MKLLRIYCLCSLVIASVYLDHGHLLPIESLVNQISARQVLFLSHGDRQNQQRSSKSLKETENWIYSHFASRLPCMWIDIDKDNVPVLLQKSNSIFLYVGMEENVDVNFVKKFKSLMVTFPALIQALLILFNSINNSSASYPDLLLRFWQEQIVDVTIIGMSSGVTENRGQKIATILRDMDYVATIHHYNPFHRVYTNRVLDSSSRLFPTKLDDLHGYTLRVGFTQHGNQQSAHFRGILGQLIEMIQLKLNFSVELDFRPFRNFGWLLANGSGAGLMGEIGPKGRLDVLAYTVFHVYDEHPFPVDRTTFLISDQVCGLVPLIKMTAFQVSSGIQWSLLVILCLVAIVWLSFFLLLRRDGASFLSSSWRPLNIGLLMMGSPIPARVVTLRERFLFGCVLLVASFYASSILAHLTSLNFDTDAYMRFETHNELDESGLIPLINPSLFNVTFGYGNDPSLHRLAEKAIQNTDIDKCLGWLLNNANVSCIAGRNLILYLQALYKDQVKQAKPCFWSAYRVIMMRQGSPYTPRFNRIIRVAQESGIFQNWWQKFHDEVAKLHINGNGVNASPKITEMRDNSHKNVFFLLLGGYGLSFLVFFMELIVGHFYVNLKRRQPRTWEQKTILIK